MTPLSCPYFYTAVPRLKSFNSPDLLRTIHFSYLTAAIGEDYHDGLGHDEAHQHQCSRLVVYTRLSSARLYLMTGKRFDTLASEAWLLAMVSHYHDIAYIALDSMYPHCTQAVHWILLRTQSLGVLGRHDTMIAKCLLLNLAIQCSCSI